MDYQDFLYEYEPGEGAIYRCGKYSIKPQQIGSRYFYTVLFKTKLLGGSETFLGAVALCARHHQLAVHL
jgi:hypothetical protein